MVRVAPFLTLDLTVIKAAAAAVNQKSATPTMGVTLSVHDRFAKFSH